MKSPYRFFVAISVSLFLFSSLLAQHMWINEIQYEVCTLAQERVEVAVELGADTAQMELVLYDGATGQLYGSYPLGIFEAGDTIGCVALYWINLGMGIQNGPDGMALVYQGVAVQFLSYEGSFVASDGPAAGYLSEDIGVSQAICADLQSLQLGGAGSSYDDFSWQMLLNATFGAINQNQTFYQPGISATLDDPPGEPVGPGEEIQYELVIRNAGPGKAVDLEIVRDSSIHTSMVPGSFSSSPLAYPYKYLQVQEDVTFDALLFGLDLDGDALSYTIVQGPQNGMLGPVSPSGPTAGNASVSYTSDLNYFGIDSFSFAVMDDDGQRDTSFVTLCIQPVNDPPSVTCGPDRLDTNTDGAVHVPGWATGFSVGPANESYQSLGSNLEVNTNTNLYSVLPALDVNTGDLTYTLSGASGISESIFAIFDNGGDTTYCSFIDTVLGPPVAMIDTPSANSAPGELFHTALNTTLNSNNTLDTNDRLTVNDDLGFFPGQVVSYGTTDNPMAAMSGTTATNNGGTVEVDAAGEFIYTPPSATFTGTDTFAYKLENTAGSSDTFAVIAVGVRPGCAPDNYDVTGNVGISVNAANGLLSNDTGDEIAVTSFQGGTAPGGSAATNRGGTASVDADGSFDYTPPASYTGLDTFTYMVGNGFGSVQCTVILDISDLIVFIDNSSGAATSDGRLSSPFKSLANFNAGTPTAADLIYIEHTGTDYNGGIVLQNGEVLFGEGHTGGANLENVLPGGLMLAPFSTTLPAINGSRPVVTNNGGDGIQLAQNNSIRGLNVGNCSAFGIDDSGATGTLSISELLINNTTGGGFRTDNGGTLAVTLGSLTSTGGTNGLHIDNCSGSLTVSNTTAVTNSTSTAVNINTNTATVTFNALNITNTTSNQTGLFASGGTVNTTAGTINTGSGRAVDVDNITSGITLTSVSCNGCVTGIDLNTTSGSFTVTGSGSAMGSGGTLQNVLQEAILLTTTSNISFNGLNMTSVTREGIKGNAVNGLAVTNGSYNNVGSADPHDVFGFNRDALGGNGLTGTALFRNLTITNFAERAIDIVNEGSGNLDLDIINVSADNNDDVFGEDAIRVQGESTINTDVLIRGGTFNNIESDVLAYFAQGSGTNNIVVSNITSTNGGGPDNNPNGGGVTIIGSGGSTTSFRIDSNNLTGVQGEPVLIVGLPGAGMTLTMTGTIGGSLSGAGNVLSTDNADGISLDFDGAADGTSTINTTIDINANIVSFDDDGMGVDYRDAAGTQNITIRNNTFTAINGDDGANDSDDGIFIFSDDDVGVAGTAHLNVAIFNNSFSGINGGDNIIDVEDIRDAGVSGCFNMMGNSAISGDENISLDFDATGNGGFVTQASTAAISTDNSGATVTIVDQNPTFNSNLCDNVPLP